LTDLRRIRRPPNERNLLFHINSLLTTKSIVVQPVMLIIAHNIKPQSQLSYINLDTCYLLYSIVIAKKKWVLFVFIAEEMRGIVESGDNKSMVLPGFLI